MKFNRIISVLITFIFCVNSLLLSQYKTEWSNFYSSNGNLSIDKAQFIASDKWGNVIVTGVSNTDGKGDDIVTIKYDKYGNQLWIAIFNGTGSYNDRPRFLVIDNDGNIIITGSSTGSGGTSDDIITLKYNKDGVLMWNNVFASKGGIGDEGSSVAADDLGNVYVTGTAGHIVTDKSGMDWVTIKYSPSGEQLWMKPYDDNISNDRSGVLTVDPAGNVYVAGQCNAPAYHIGIAKYDNSGNLLWFAKYDGKSVSYDKPTDIKTDNEGNVYLTGYSSEDNKDILTLKLDYLGNIVWKKNFNGPANGSDEAQKLLVDKEGNVYVAGTVEAGKKKQYRILLKYDNSGSEVWKNISDKPLSKNIETIQLLLNSSGNLLVTGSSVISGKSYSEMAADCFSPAGGLLWQHYFSAENSIPTALNAALDPDDNILLGGFITGQGNYNYCTVKFSK